MAEGDHTFGYHAAVGEGFEITKQGLLEFAHGIGGLPGAGVFLNFFLFPII